MSLPLGGPALQSALQDSTLDAALPAWTSWAAVGLVTLSTLAGARLARHNIAKISLWLAIASALMLITALTDLLPDAWREATATGVPLWLVALAGLFGFSVITYFTRKGCGHQHDRAQVGRHSPGLHRRVKQAVSAAVYGGVGTAAALALHRMIEGATLALAASAIVVAALVIHSASEGLALAALLDLARKPLAPWLTVACLSPAAGVVLATVAPLPAQSVPILLGMVTGVLLRTAVIGLTMARANNGGQLSRRHIVLTTAAVLATGGMLVTSQTLLAADPSHSALPTAAAHRLPAPPTRPPQTPTPLTQPASATELRAAVATGQLGLEALLSRRDPATIEADVASLLRALPGRTPAQITQTMREAKIDNSARIGDLTLRQRHLLLTALSQPPAAQPQ
ncbi:hypothetical protein ACQP2T_48340 [Nonomuraea sp. CA-143628]|uniref:hypothetical protein n=1 Tax=Nonomuraea sp. CA-143628 TaxID=3239997 RepID=UPI003D9246CF